MSCLINASTSGAGGIITTADSSGVLNIQTAGTTAISVDASQNVGIGTSSPAQKLQVDSTGATSTVFSRNGGTNANTNVQFKNSTTSFYLGTNSSGNFAIKYNDPDLSTSPNMVIDSSNNLQFNSGYGSVATAYGCRAWVNFNGTGTVAIRASGNVTSITDNGTGNYTVNFTTAMPDANYSFSCSGRENTAGGSRSDLGISAWSNSTSISTSSLQIGTAYMSTAVLFDAEVVCVHVFR